MKTGYKILVGSLVTAALLMVFNTTIQYPRGAYAAQLTPGYSFTTNEQVTHIKLNDLVSNATVSGIVSADITDTTIATADLANQAVTSAKIADATILTGDVAQRTLLGANVATGALSEVELSTNITFRPGFLTFSNNVSFVFSTNQVSSYAILGTNAAGTSASAGLVAKLNGIGFLDSSMYSNVVTLVSSNFPGKNIAHGSSYTYSTLETLTTTATTGKVLVQASVANDDPSGATQFIRIRDSTGAAVGDNTYATGSASPVMTAMLFDVLAGSAKTYTLEVASASATTENYTNILTSADTAAPATNAFYIKIYQFP